MNNRRSTASSTLQMQQASRRQFLASIGTASAVLMAGCSTGGSSGGSGNSINDNTVSREATTDNAGETAGGKRATKIDSDESGETTRGGNETTSGNSGETTTVAAGPDGRLVFEPEQIDISVGGTVIWEFKSPGHNVSAVPEDNKKVSIPSKAKPFASYESGDLYAVVPEGKTYQYTFETSGEYTYVCIPHAASGMVGTVIVTQ